MFGRQIEFGRDRGGTVAMIMALAALPTFGAVALAVDHGRATTAHGEVASILAEACARLTTPVIRYEPIAAQADAAQALLDRRLVDMDISGSSATAIIVDDAVHVMFEGDLGSIMPDDYTGLAVDLTLDCSTGAPAGKQVADVVVFTESFENPINDAGWSWQVRPAFPNWTTLEGPGVEIHRPAFRSMDRNIFRGQFPTPPDGEQFAELDATFDRGAQPATTSNTAMATEIYLTSGQYRLSAQYMIKLRANAGNGIDVFMEPTGQPAMSNRLGSMDGASSWQTYQFDMTAPADGYYRLALRATGAANDNGGAIDDIVLRRIGP